jgi:hypothetical protein
LEVPASDVTKQLVQAYVCAYHHSYGERPSFAKTKIADMRKLILVAKALATAHVRPVAWVMSRIDFYEKYAGSKRTSGGPALGWVYSPKAVEERMDWYSAHEATHLGGRVLLTEEHRELIRRYGEMKRALYVIAAREGRVPDRTEVAAVVAEHLPTETYKDLSSKVHRKARMTSQALDKRIARGEYVW